MVTSLHEKVQSERLYRAFDLMSAKNLEAAEQELNAGVDEAAQESDTVLLALFFSTLGVLYKIKKDFTKAWKFYEKAEKLLPEDPALKLISARLLIDVFGQFDTAIRRCQKVLEISPRDPPFRHQADVTMGLAYLKKGERSKAVQCLIDAMQDNFEGLMSAGNVDLKLLEELIRRKAGLEECRIYLEKAKLFAEQNNEEKHADLMRRLLEAFPGDESVNR